MSVPDNFREIIEAILWKAGDAEVACRMELHEHAAEWSYEVARRLEDSDEFTITGQWDNDE